MIYLIPTKRGIGVEMWGTYEDLKELHGVIGRFWADENYESNKGFENRDALLSSFSYEIRKAKEGSRMKRKKSHLSFENQEYFGTAFSWVHILFSLTAIKYNMRYYETNKYEISLILLLEFWLEKAMYSYDEIGAQKLRGFIEDGLYGANDLIYQFMRSINYEFFLLGGGKKAFRQLPILLKRGIYYTQEYTQHENFLKAEAVRLNCDASELEVGDDDFDYGGIEW
ncbi:MAG TPA: hypothetical protein PK323_00985 [Bacteroidia bacterium]|nr:hypothetical protein [Bacteroidia bacterium]